MFYGVFWRECTENESHDANSVIIGAPPVTAKLVSWQLSIFNVYLPRNYLSQN